MICRRNPVPADVWLHQGMQVMKSWQASWPYVHTSICLMASNPTWGELENHCKADLHLTVALPNSGLDP